MEKDNKKIFNSIAILVVLIGILLIGIYAINQQISSKKQASIVPDIVPTQECAMQGFVCRWFAPEGLIDKFYVDINGEKITGYPGSKRIIQLDSCPNNPPFPNQEEQAAHPDFKCYQAVSDRLSPNTCIVKLIYEGMICDQKSEQCISGTPPPVTVTETVIITVTETVTPTATPTTPIECPTLLPLNIRILCPDCSCTGDTQCVSQSDPDLYCRTKFGNDFYCNNYECIRKGAKDVCPTATPIP